MSTGALYTLLANDGNQDKILLATELLNKRIHDIKKIKCKDPFIKNKYPTLVDLEKTHVIFIHSHFKPFAATAYEYAKIGVNTGEAGFSKEIAFSLPQFGDFFSDMVVHVQLTGLAAGITSTAVRYADFVGHRLFKKVKFEVNNNILDEYTSDVYNFHYNFTVSENKKRAWKMNVGQEVPYDAILTQNPLVDTYREVKKIVSGPQTPKPIHNVIDLWIPLMFWFNKDPCIAIPSVSIPFGQRFIKILIADAVECVQGLPTIDFTTPRFTNCELYINNIFMNPEIHDIFIKRVGFSLIRVHRIQTEQLTEQNGSIKLDDLKYPIETMYVGCRPIINDGTMENWNRYHTVIDTPITYPVAIPNPGIPPPTHIIMFTNAIYKEQVPILTELTVETKGIELWRTTPSQFFNSYTPYIYGGQNINTPEDIGMYMVPFNFYPGTYQPSGYINVTRTREFYIKYNSTNISNINPATLVVIGIALNFLVVREGTAVLRYNL